MRNSTSRMFTAFISFAVIMIFCFLALGLRKCDGQTHHPRQNTFYSTQYPNSLAVSFAPTELGVGVRYGYQFGQYGAYAYLLHGTQHINKYRLLDNKFQKVVYIPHTQTTLGITRYIQNTFGDNIDALLAIGLNYHYYANKSEAEPTYTPRVFSPLSFEVGIGTLFRRTTMGFSFDFMKGASNVYLGFKF